MVVELEFLDNMKTRIHEKSKVYENFGGPIPNVEETVCIEGKFYKVVKRDFIYLDKSGIDLRVSFWCEELNF
ncbi:MULTISPECIES: hypothetical protein [Bacillus cereus group]|uniref:Uncharacterized protein n=1 Tax=uncultured Caudovirales phage TaxID=2100421 RepID=A0A2H4J825_9CAUD|nr:MULTISPECIES: hypothetical protein [Bacillus cereus group]ASN71410.1 hypothetical protein 3F9_3 [uncultured Caudovirales phage]MDR4969760.1 hypothetical protein [Bacillus toyonensis]PEZ60887.1 hypothetical protein CN370_11405 [Bacillus cereus]